MRDTTQKTHAIEDPLPLFYRTPVVLRHREHAHAGLLRKVDLGFAAGATAVPIYAGEFAAAAMDYPIVFSELDPAVPLAVIGIRAGHNLLVDETGSWRPGFYVPAYIRRYPFIAADFAGAGDHLLAVDSSCGRFLAEIGQSDADVFFEDDGAPTAFARAAMQLCKAIVDDQKRTEAFSRALAEQKLLTPKHANFQLPDGKCLSLDGFRLIDRDAYRKMSGTTLATWHENGWLDLAVLQQASEVNWAKLLRLHTEISHSRKSMQ